MQRRLLGTLAPALIMFFAACTAAVEDREEQGASSAAIEKPTTPTKAKAEAKAGGGFSCSAGNIEMPKELPDVETCINDDGKGGGPSTGCAGWSKVGARVVSSAELRSVVDKGAQLYKIRPGGDTLCLYLYRGDAKVTKGSFNGVHCYNESTCDVCWWDAETKPGVKPTAADLEHSSADDCASCHRNGPLLPKFELWDALNTETIDLHQVCSKAGGPTWAQPMATWSYATPDTSLIVKAPSSCGTGGCHENGFEKQGDYCELLSHAFSKDNGSMRKSREKFPSAAACIQFAKDMDCDLAVKDHAIDCADAEVSDP